MRLLLLGGTDFAGRAVAEGAVARGWDVTVFHRGEHPAPPGVQVRHGDRTREDGLAALATGEWDAVVDTWSGAPTVVRDAAALLAGRAGRHAFVSSRSVYAWPAPAGLDEFGPSADGDPDAEATDFAADKRGSELAVLRAFGAERTLLVRPGLILGPRENVGRLPWWLARIARGGEIPAPGPRETPLQYIDVRDLATWLLDALESALHGPYNLVSQPGHTTIGELLDTCVRVTGATAELRWTPPEAIAAAGVSPWTDLPIWAPPGTDFHAAIHAGDVTRAHATGLHCRPVTETIEDTWTWQQSVPEPELHLAAGLTAQAEATLVGGRP
ncbi:NAD-dependent epimerase/dehydratase family protein [Streptomyces sp. NBC_01294]|uniref:NAD-dependent epimerase/dehydratase family protein n=1 Tax=Streptomyces sp. NBC_01294 TaxID=2903815 RepID=UPI002DD8988A|nr:NAD-dependent epimerase/dehydratase family protein [Streptomyces sp. NBC_01294]WRZ57932.1 NAD-dependent epimerase/dehydratase family protein [Streptomyces sp. NBC_01294]